MAPTVNGFDPDGALTADVLRSALYTLEGSPSTREGDAIAVWTATLPTTIPASASRGAVKDLLDAYARSRGIDAAGLMIGDENGELKLDRTMTRAEFAQVLLRLSKRQVPIYTETMDLQVLATSDLHGKFYPYNYAANAESTSGSMVQLSTAVKTLRTANSLLLDAGDSIQDNSAQIFLDEEIHPMIAAINAIGYDVWVTGNHEYNFGMDTLKKVISTVKGKVLVGNVYDDAGKALADGD